MRAVVHYVAVAQVLVVLDVLVGPVVDHCKHALMDGGGEGGEARSHEQLNEAA